MAQHILLQKVLFSSLFFFSFVVFFFFFVLFVFFFILFFYSRLFFMGLLFREHPKAQPGG